MKQKYQLIKPLFYTLLLLPSLLFGQWTTQTVTLNPGWNAIYVEVEPLPNDCSTIFNGVNIESVMASTDQFEVANPALDNWVYYPTGSSETSTLFSLQGGKTYSINYLGTSPTTVAISGRPILNELAWKAATYQEAGFPVSTTNPPTFASYLANETAFGNNAVEQMNSNGVWVPIANSQQIIKGQAYRLKANEFSNYASPFTVELEQNNSLDFDQIRLTQIVRINNHTNTVEQIDISTAASEDNVFARYNLAGEVALNYWDTDNKVWVNLANGLSLNVPANDKLLLRLSIDRLQMPFTSNGQYQSLLTFKNQNGTELVIPASGFGLLNRTGLWVGTATINAINDVNKTSNAPEATDSEFTIKLIVHVDDTGKANILDQVTQMWQDGTYKPDPTDASQRVVDVPGQYVLITDDALLPLFSGATIRDGKGIGRRISSAFFSFDEPQSMKGIFDGTLEDTIILGYDHPLNPFKHKYHPDHNNMDERNENQLPNGVESYTVSRAIQLAFSTNDPDNLSFAGFGDNQAGGTYIETVTGLHKDKLFVKGTFRLNRVSTIGKLNLTSTPAEINQRNPQPRTTIPVITPTEDQTTSIDEIKVEEELPSIQVYPNPVKDNIQLIGLEKGTYHLRVRDLSGKSILSQIYHPAETVHAQNLLPGIYTLEVRNKKWVQTIKFIKI